MPITHVTHVTCIRADSTSSSTSLHHLHVHDDQVLSGPVRYAWFEARALMRMYFRLIPSIAKQHAKMAPKRHDAFPRGKVEHA